MYVRYTFVYVNIFGGSVGNDWDGERVYHSRVFTFLSLALFGVIKPYKWKNTHVYHK